MRQREQVPGLISTNLFGNRLNCSGSAFNTIWDQLDDNLWEVIGLNLESILKHHLSEVRYVK